MMNPTNSIQNTPPSLALIGPTACGKSRIALALAEQFECEIISMDSAMVYRELNIGTAKPSIAERNTVVHHLIDICSPSEGYNAAQFAADARQLIDEIQKRGKRPLIVGGTLLYLKALQEGLHHLPSSNDEVRCLMQTQLEQHGLSFLYARLQQVDAPLAAKLSSNDKQRIMRALEVWELSHKPMSEWLNAPKLKNHVPLKLIALSPLERDNLYQTINTRFTAMIEQGLIEEVENLFNNHIVSNTMPSMRLVGYRQVCEYLTGAIDKQQMIEKGQMATRHLAKRQLTWLRSLTVDQTIACDDLQAENKVLRAFAQIVDTSFTTPMMLTTLHLP